ncbi:MAG: hypothetical protein HY033_08925 [Ignavibacteriae bacterium]|nr:hypothetical protein [Ignavibacteria bacterium]MBI3365014.1 hypothetical protein [Ignavibacteriota bacterium]
MKKHFCICMSVVLSVLSFLKANAQGHSVSGNDHLFAHEGKSMVTLATGIPYLGIAEYAYGFSERFSLGLSVGVTPTVEGYGLRIRAVILQPRENFRLYARMPIFYYPKTEHGEPWMLAWPVVSAEWILQSGTRLSIGGGVVAAACMNSILGRKDMEDKEHEFMGGVWNTVHAGVAVPLNRSIMLQTEVSSVMSGLKFAGKDWIGGPPVIVVLGISISV